MYILLYIDIFGFKICIFSNKNDTLLYEIIYVVASQIWSVEKGNIGERGVNYQP